MINRIVRTFFVLLWFTLAIGPMAIGQSRDGPGTSPDQSLSNLVQRLKATKDPLVILDFVHWPTAFKNMPARERQAIRVSSEADLKSHFQKLFQNPDGFLKDQLSAKFPGLSEEKRKEIEHSQARLVAAMKDQRQRMQERLSKTDYQIGKVDANGNNANIELISMLEGETKISKVKLERVGSTWYLPSVRFVQEQKGGGEDR